MQPLGRCLLGFLRRFLASISFVFWGKFQIFFQFNIIVFKLLFSYKQYGVNLPIFWLEFAYILGLIWQLPLGRCQLMFLVQFLAEIRSYFGEKFAYILVLNVQFKYIIVFNVNSIVFNIYIYLYIDTQLLPLERCLLVFLQRFFVSI